MHVQVNKETDRHSYGYAYWPARHTVFGHSYVSLYTAECVCTVGGLYACVSVYSWVGGWVWVCRHLVAKANISS